MNRFIFVSSIPAMKSGELRKCLMLEISPEKTRKTWFIGTQKGVSESSKLLKAIPFFPGEWEADKICAECRETMYADGENLQCPAEHCRKCKKQIFPNISPALLLEITGKTESELGL